MYPRWMIVACLFLSSGCGSAVQHPEILAVLEAQQAAWNRGDIDQFMQGYWVSDNLTFGTPEGQTRGWQAIRDRFKAKYQHAGQMGKLTFDRLTVARTGPDTADVSGTFHLSVSEGVRSGRFYLKMRRIDAQWVIVQDFTTPDS